MDDKGRAIPVILKKKIQETSPLQINVEDKKIHRQVSREEAVSFDKIMEDSESKFYITGKTTKIGLMNFLTLFEKHDTNEIENLNEEEIVVSSELVTQIATSEVIDEEDEDLKYIDAVAIGIFTSSLLLSVFILSTSTLADIKTLGWILLVVSLVFLGNYTYKGVKSGNLMRVMRVIIKSLSRK